MDCRFYDFEPVVCCWACGKYIYRGMRKCFYCAYPVDSSSLVEWDVRMLAPAERKKGRMWLLVGVLEMDEPVLTKELEEKFRKKAEVRLGR